MKKKQKLIYLINKWLDINEELKTINKYIYEHTELFEEKYETDYNWELYNFFAKKITKYGKEKSELLKLLTYKDKENIIILNRTLEQETFREERITKEEFENWVNKTIRSKE